MSHKAAKDLRVLLTPSSSTCRPEVANGRLFGLGGSYLGANSGMAGQSSFYDGQSDPGEICP